MEVERASRLGRRRQRACAGARGSVGRRGPRLKWWVPNHPSIDPPGRAGGRGRRAPRDPLTATGSYHPFRSSAGPAVNGAAAAAEARTRRVAHFGRKAPVRGRGGA